MKQVSIKLPIEDIESFCKKWKIKELALFGSVLRSDFNPKESDIDVLVTFFPDIQYGWDIVTMRDDLELIFKRRVDFIEKETVEKSKNKYRKKEILSTYEVIYEQAS